MLISMYSTKNLSILLFLYRLALSYKIQTPPASHLMTGLIRCQSEVCVTEIFVINHIYK